MATRAVRLSIRSANASGGIVIPSALGTNSTSNSGRDSHWWPIVGKSSSPIRILLRPSGSGRPEASVVKATDTEGAIAVDPGGALSRPPTPVRSRSRSGSQSENQTGVPFVSQSWA